MDYEFLHALVNLLLLGRAKKLLKFRTKTIHTKLQTKDRGII